MVRKTAFTTTAALMGLVPGLDAIPMVTESLEGRIRVLYVADQGPHRNYPQLDLLERHTDLRFIYQRNSSPAARGNDESAAVCDGLLWDSAGFPAQQTQRIERLAGYLERRHFDMLVLEGKDHLPRIQDAIVAYVKDGGTLVWLGTNLPRQLKRADSDAPETSQALNELCPWRKDDEAVAKQKAAKVRSLVRKGTRIGLDVLEQTHPLVCGFPLDAMLGHRNRPTPALLPKQDTACLAQWQTTEHGVLGVMSVGKGRVIGITTGSLVPPSHTMGNWGRIDREMLWLRFWQHLGRVVKHGDNANPTRLSVTTGEETVQSGDSFPVTLQAFGLPGGRQEDATVSLVAPDGSVIEQETVQLSPSSEATMDLTVPENVRSGAYLVRAVLPTAEGTPAIEAFDIRRIEGPLTATLASDRRGGAAGETLTFTAELASRIPQSVDLDLLVSDGMGVVVHHEQRKASVTVDETREETFEWTLPDYGVDGWAFSAQLVANGEQGTDRSTVWFWRYEPWTMREKILISNYWGGDGSVPAAMMPLFAKYHRGIGYSAAHHWREPYLSRFNMRAWYQHGATRMEVFTNNFRTPDFSHLRERVAKNLNRDSRLHSAAWVIRDFGEETGFYYHWSNNPFGRTWKTNEDIPEGAHRFFRMYVQEKYGEVARLNDAWEREFATFDQVELDTRYGYPAGWLYMRPPEQLPANLAPVIDTHGFFFWYTERVAETYTDALRERNPTADWGMSFSLTFNLFSPIPMTMVHPVYNAQVLQAWHNKAIMRSRGGSTPIFSFHWGFDEDARAWGQFWNNSLVSGSTFISNWGSQFNFDLTHSRSTILLKRLMARVKPREKFFLDLYPVDDFDVGIYHPDLDWQTVHSRPRFYLDAQGPNDMAMGQLGYKSTGTGWLGGPEAQMFSLLSASGYTPRFVTEADIPKCRVLVVPYVETMPVTAAARMREMVAAGGMLITMPVIAQYNGNGKPFDTIPGGGLDELLGLTLDPEIVGQRSMVILPHDDEQLPMRFTPRMGSEPPYLWSFGHQHVRSLAENTHVVLRNYENEPMITVHPFGDGQAVHLNAMTFHHWGQYELSEFHEESLRQLLDNLVRAGGVEPALFVERPFRYGTGINDWVQYQYQLKDSDIRVLALYSDKMSQKILGQVVLNEPAAAVYDILNGERMPLRRRGGGQVVEEMEPFAFTTRSKAALREGTVFPVELNPGEAAFFAVLPHAPGTITLSMHTDQLIPGQDDLHCVVRISTENGTPPSGAHPVELIVRDSSGTRMPMLSRKLSVTGETDVIVPTRLGDPPGDWTVIARDCVTGLEARKTLRALPNPKMQNVPRTEDIVYPSAAPRRIDVNDSEFIALLNALRELYLTGAERDKGALSYYAFDRDVSRHRINQLLGHADWRRKVEAVRNHVAAGNDVILAGEDFGVDPATGLSLDPVHGPEQDDSMDMSVGGRLPAVDGAHRREAITRICGRDVFAEAWPDGRLHVKIGKGTLTLDAVSFDELGQMNGHFLLNHDRWLKTIKQKQR